MASEECQPIYSNALRSLQQKCGERHCYRAVFLSSSDAIAQAERAAQSSTTGRILVACDLLLSRFANVPIGAAHVVLCDKDGLAELQTKGVQTDETSVPIRASVQAVPLYLGPKAVLESDEPILLEVSSAAGLNDVDRNSAPLTCRMSNSHGTSETLFLGHLSFSEMSHRPTRRLQCALRIPEGISGLLAVDMVLVALDRFLGHVVQSGTARPMLLRVDYAGLGMRRPEYRRLERYVSKLFATYSKYTQKPGLMLGELGFVRGYTDASAVLAPDDACRVDVVVPEWRSTPIYLNVEQQLAKSGRPPISISLRSPDGSETELHPNHSGLGFAHHGELGEICAVIVPPDIRDEARGPGPYVIGFGPTQSVPLFGRCQALAGRWEVTVTNCGKVSSAVALYLEDPMPLLPHWQSPRATVRKSGSQAWDPDMLDFIRPVFFDLRSRYEALSRYADFVPPLVLRRYADPTTWPLVSICRNSRLIQMVFNEANGEARPVAEDDRQPAQLQGLAPIKSLQDSQDTLLDGCIYYLRHSSPETVEQRIGDALERRAT